MKFNFKIQQYQTDAVEAVCRVFNGQKHYEQIVYRRDLGVTAPKLRTTTLNGLSFEEADSDLLNDTGYKNEQIELSSEQLLENIHEIQRKNNIKLSSELIKDLGKVSLDTEMETGTGKTYVYIKTMFELNKRFGWSKFIVVVPSIAIREGVKKSFEITQNHFMEHYNKKARFFIYNSSNLHQLDEFSSGSGINVMIINTQAFATSLKEGANNKESRIIYDKRDEFASRRPIDVLAANNPIIIRDEPQKMSGEVTQKALQNFKPLFMLNYSATHKKQHNLIYVLDALDAYNKRLVKKIEVKGFEIKNLRGTDKYLYLENIMLSPKKPPIAKIEFDVTFKNSINRKTRNLNVGDNLYYLSNEMEQYKDGYTISEIDPILGMVTFANGEIISKGDVVGDSSESNMRRVQIRETILSHFEKEEELFNKGIKTLSLFFVDEVAKYRQYDENNNEIVGDYGKIFEEEYKKVVNEFMTHEDTPYQRHLKKIEVNSTHKGYFSVDKKSGRTIDSELKRGNEFSDDISAYDLILKNKERLLSFDEPTRFIFSHSALREGWDNPNVFQICTLKHSESTTMKRQEVGRGLRICVNQDGSRMDAECLGQSVHTVNMLTVIASESYKKFVGDLQKEIKDDLYDRPSKATAGYFEGKTIMVGEKYVVLNKKQADVIHRYLIKNDYVDNDDNITDAYHADVSNGCLADLPEELQPMTEETHKLIQGIFDESILDDMIENGNKTKFTENTLNDNFYKKEFQSLWNYINHKYAYIVDFDSQELVDQAVKSIKKNLNISKLQYTVSTGTQRRDMNEYELERGDAFDIETTKTETLKQTQSSQIKYDLIGDVAKGTTLTRRTIGAILHKISLTHLSQFRNNPEEFISKVIKLINDEKATMIVEHISYNNIDGEYDSSIFTVEKNLQSFDKAFRAEKHIQDYVFTDGLAEKSVERTFAENLDNANEVCVYAKLPRGFSIPTPVGDYSPDWAIAFNESEDIKHIYFIAETKGSVISMDLRKIEDVKVSCAKKLFNEISTDNLRYHEVTSYGDLLNIVK